MEKVNEQIQAGLEQHKSMLMEHEQRIRKTMNKNTHKRKGNEIKTK